MPLEKVQTVLRIYVEGLTGKEVEIAPLSAMPQESRIGDGKTIYLPATVAEFKDDEMDFRLYKVLAAHGAGQIEFGTYERDSKDLKAAFAELNELYEATAEQTGRFFARRLYRRRAEGRKGSERSGNAGRIKKTPQKTAEKFGLPSRFADFSRTASGEKDFRHDGKRAD